MAHAPINEPPEQTDDGVLAGLRDIPGLPVRVGRHMTAWLLWHTARISLIDDVQPSAAAELDRTARA